MRRAALAFLVAAVAACSYNPDYGNGVLRCEPGGICPGNLVCDVDNVCRAQGTEVDAPVTDIDAPMPIDGMEDTTPPDTSLTSMPSAISGPDVSFVMASTEANSTFRCSLDSPTLAPCNATQSFTALTAGQHTFRAAATDMAGNEDPTPVEFTWTVDPTVLDTTIVTGPGATSGPNPTFSFTSTRPGSTFECQLAPTETVFTSCTSPRMYTALPERPAPGYTFSVRARDTAGNLDDTPATRTFAVDATGPVVTIQAPTNNATVGTSVTLMFSSETGATHTCQLDNQAVINNCTSPRTFTGLTSAMIHSIRVTATDSFGNVGTPAVHTFTVDDQGPSVSISGAPTSGQQVNTTSANLSFAIVPANEPAPFSFECRFNSTGAFAPCTNFIMSGLVEGSQSLEVRAIDRFNNRGPITTHAWTIQALFTTILNIRGAPVAVGTRVQINNTSNQVRMTRRSPAKLWVQEADGLATTTNRGITVIPTAGTANSLYVEGRSMNVIGTVTNQNGNLVLTQATIQTGSLLTAYRPKDTNRTASNLLQEGNEGMLVNMSGRASTTAAASCQNFDFCIVSCFQSTPVIDSIDAANTVMINEDHFFNGIVEGNGSGYTYFVTEATDASDACL